jgi:hypothetical protein
MSNLRFKADLLAVVKGEGKASQDALTNKRLVTQYGHSDANHLGPAGAFEQKYTVSI